MTSGRVPGATTDLPPAPEKQESRATTHEYYTACEDLQMPRDVLCDRIVAAAQAGFLAQKEKEKLVTQLKKELKM